MKQWLEIQFADRTEKHELLADPENRTLGIVARGCPGCHAFPLVLTASSPARIQAPSLGLALAELHDPELERNTLGAAMLGEPMPAWLELRHFFSALHGRIYATVLAVGGELPLVAARLRDEGWLYTATHGPDRHSKPGMLSSVDLAQMCIEAKFARDYGWANDVEQLRELWRQRQLVELMTREAIRLRAGVATHAEVIRVLVAHGEEVR